MTKRLLALLGLVLVAAPLRAQTIDPAWMQVDSAARKVSFALLAGTPGVNGGLNFNGFTSGKLTFAVPVGWQVIMVLGNMDHALTHSFEVISPREPLPIQAVAPSIAGAGSKELLLGLPATSPPETVRFTATTAGEYLVYCGVPGHGMAGMWVRLHVDASAHLPTMMAERPLQAH